MAPLVYFLLRVVCLEGLSDGGLSASQVPSLRTHLERQLYHHGRGLAGAGVLRAGGLDGRGCNNLDMVTPCIGSCLGGNLCLEPYW